MFAIAIRLFSMVAIILFCSILLGILYNVVYVSQTMNIVYNKEDFSRVDLLSTESIDLDAAPQVVDGVAALDGNTILCLGQSDTNDNGVYIIADHSCIRMMSLRQNDVYKITRGTKHRDKLITIDNLSSFSVSLKESNSLVSNVVSNNQKTVIGPGQSHVVFLGKDVLSFNLSSDSHSVKTVYVHKHPSVKAVALNGIASLESEFNIVLLSSESCVVASHGQRRDVDSPGYVAKDESE